MGKRVELSGEKFGCYTVIEKAPSVKVPSGATVGVWHIKCDCGKEKTIRAQALRSSNHFSCGKTCTLRGDAKIDVNCIKCGIAYKIRKDTVTKALRTGGTRTCKKCLLAYATLYVIGKPSPNRLPDGEAAFNSLYAAYKRHAIKYKKVEFSLSKAQFLEITRKSCSYCGTEPSTIRNGDAVRSKGKHSGVYVYNGIDCIDSKIGYIVSNIVPCCWECNRMKGRMSLKDFFMHIEKVSSFKKHVFWP